MRRGNKLGAILLYVAFIGMLAIYIMSLYWSITGLADERERAVRIWTDILTIFVVISEIESMLVMNRLSIFLTGKTLNIVDDLFEENSQDFAVRYNGVTGWAFFTMIIMALSICYLYTQNRLFLGVSVFLVIVFGVGVLVYVLATYLKTKDELPESSFLKNSNSVFLPLFICMVQLLITRRQLVGFVYKNIYSPPNDIYLVAALIIVLCYLLASVYCHFSNIYCLVGFIYVKKDLTKIQKEIDALKEGDRERETYLRKTTKYVDEKTKQVGHFKKIELAILWYYVNVKIYIQERFYAGRYLLLFIKLKITKCFRGLLEPERIRINGVRFCWVAAVFELLTLDLLLFMYLESDDPCLKFFELLSTVIIIPVLLSWLAELKTKKE